MFKPQRHHHPEGLCYICFPHISLPFQQSKKQEQSLGFGAPLLFCKVSIRFLLLEENFYNILQESKEKLRLF